MSQRGPTAPPTLLLSDLHLAPERPAALAAFHAFAAGPARDAAAVYVLGDLFDWWVGDDQMRDPVVATVVAALRGIADAGIPLFVARGNRDFLLGERFARATGATLLPEFIVVELAGARTLLCHGDELCADDAEYQAYRTRMRDPRTQARLLRLPYAARCAIAWWLRRKSSNEKALKPESIMDVAPDAVTRAFRQHDVARLIHGHTHRPALHIHDVDGVARERYVMADWHDCGHYLAVDANGIHARTISG
ncbi:MAG: UDP-2,3-diacylglucosamine diphosphatase [Burkholderiales bacterium]|nr:UDP-2,3-diacylglucosamine diphosphatase [Burkholderiales bacterium]